MIDYGTMNVRELLSECMGFHMSGSPEGMVGGRRVCSSPTKGSFLRLAGAEVDINWRQVKGSMLAAARDFPK